MSLGQEDRPRASAWPLVLTVVAAIGLLAYGLLWLEPFALGRFEPFETRAESITAILGADWAGLTHYSLAMVVPFSLYGVALAVAHRSGSWGLYVTAAFAAAAPLLLLYTYPALAADPFDYLMGGRIMADYGLNPYGHTASQFADDPYAPPVGWPGLPFVYGPAWAYTMFLVVALSGDSAEVALVLVKAVAVLSHLGVAAFVYLLARHFRPERAPTALVAYAWNPLVIVHFALDGHNDAFMLLWLMASLYAAVQGRWLVALPLLTLGGLVKFVPFALLPLYLLAGRSHRQALLGGVLVSLALVAVTYAPLWQGINTFDGLRDQAGRWTSSPTALLAFVLPDASLRPIGALVFAAGYLLALRRQRDLVEGSFLVLALYLVALSGWTKGWYFSWLLALGAVAGAGALWIAVAASIGAFVVNVFGGWAWVMHWWMWEQRWGLWMMEAWLTASLYLPPLLAGGLWLAIQWRADRQRKAAVIPRARVS